MVYENLHIKTGRIYFKARFADGIVFAGEGSDGIDQVFRKPHRIVKFVQWMNITESKMMLNDNFIIQISLGMPEKNVVNRNSSVK